MSENSKLSERLGQSPSPIAESRGKTLTRLSAGKNGIDHAVVGRKLKEARYGLMDLIEPLQKSYGKTSKQFKSLLKSLDEIDHLRTILEDKMCRGVQQDEG